MSNSGARAMAVQLFRRVSREIPRLITIYDLPHSAQHIRAGVAARFRHFADIKDDRVVGMLVSKGEMELEESLMQWKQKTHVVRLIESFCAPSGTAAAGGTTTDADWHNQGRAFLGTFHFGADSTAGTQEMLFGSFWAK